MLHYCTSRHISHVSTVACSIHRQGYGWQFSPSSLHNFWHYESYAGSFRSSSTLISLLPATNNSVLMSMCIHCILVHLCVHTAHGCMRAHLCICTLHMGDLCANIEILLRIEIEGLFEAALTFHIVWDRVSLFYPCRSWPMNFWVSCLCLSFPCRVVLVTPALSGF